MELTLEGIILILPLQLACHRIRKVGNHCREHGEQAGETSHLSILPVSERQHLQVLFRPHVNTSSTIPSLHPSYSLRGEENKTKCRGKIKVKQNNNDNKISRNKKR